MSLSENARIYAAIGTATLGLATGLAASYNVIVIPMINNSKVKAPEKLKLWRQGYNLGKAIMIPLPISGAVLLAITSYSIKDISPASRTLAIAAALGTGHFWTTLALMLPTNNRLMALESQPSVSEVEGKETDDLVTTWTGLHAIRVGWLAAAFATAFTGLLSL